MEEEAELDLATLLREAEQDRGKILADLEEAENEQDRLRQLADISREAEGRCQRAFAELMKELTDTEADLDACVKEVAKHRAEADRLRAAVARAEQLLQANKVTLEQYTLQHERVLTENRKFALHFGALRKKMSQLEDEVAQQADAANYYRSKARELGFKD